MFLNIHSLQSVMLFMFEFLHYWKKYSLRMTMSYPNNHKNILILKNLVMCTFFFFNERSVHLKLSSFYN